MQQFLSNFETCNLFTILYVFSNTSNGTTAAAMADSSDASVIPNMAGESANATLNESVTAVNANKIEWLEKNLSRLVMTSNQYHPLNCCHKATGI